MNKDENINNWNICDVDHEFEKRILNNEKEFRKYFKTELKEIFTAEMSEVFLLKFKDKSIIEIKVEKLK